MPPCVYILELRSGQLYVGRTSHIGRCWNEHLSGRGGERTRRDQPRRIIHLERFSDTAAAQHRERQLKGWSREKKWRLALQGAGDTKCGGGPRTP